MKLLLFLAGLALLAVAIYYAPAFARAFEDAIRKGQGQ